MKPALILPLLLVSQLLTACFGSSVGGKPRIDDLPANVKAKCARPGDFLGLNDWEIMAGRIGDELIDCGLKQQAAVAHVEAIVAATKPDYWQTW